MNLKSFIKNNLSPLLMVLVFGLLFVISMQNGYFWDNIQQTSKEAHWFYLNHFQSLLMPGQNSGSEIVATGYHPPLMGIMTAILWNIFGYKLWVSHAFILFWAVVLFFQLWKLLSAFFNKKTIGWVFMIVLLEPTVLSQFSIASPDFILFVAFVISLRSILEHKPILLSIGLFFLCGINMRGVFAGVILLISNGYYIYLQQNKKLSFQSTFRILLPYIPVFLLLSGYYIYYIINRGWFFSNETTSDHYALPTNVYGLFKHLAEFGLRTIENGRILVWAFGFYVAFYMLRNKSKLMPHEKMLFFNWLMLNGLYFIFVFITQMPFSGRYFIPQFFLLTVFVLYKLVSFWEIKKTKAVFILILIFEITGNFWIYPNKIAKSWDGTLAHISYYELRNDCFNYIDKHKINYNDISGGFCIYGDRKFVELSNAGKIVGDKPDKKYFIYSNISNVPDSLFNSLSDSTKWIPVKQFNKGFVEICLFENKEMKSTVKKQ
jgi:hypothetical protein